MSKVKEIEIVIGSEDEEGVVEAEEIMLPSPASSPSSSPRPSRFSSSQNIDEDEMNIDDDDHSHRRKDEGEKLSKDEISSSSSDIGEQGEHKPLDDQSEGGGKKEENDSDEVVERPKKQMARRRRFDIEKVQHRRAPSGSRQARLPSFSRLRFRAF